MAHGQLGTAVDRLRRLAGDGDQTDRALLRKFAQDQDQSAFTILVQRHGSMVLGVCRRVLGNPQDAEDAFQATFLVLARKAASDGWSENVGQWLYEVAIRTAQKARVSDARRKARERRAAQMTRPESTPESEFALFQAVLDEEIHKLPSDYVMPIVLCCLQGQTHEQAAATLGVTAGTIRARLWRGRELLRQRLHRRGITLSASAMMALLSQSTSTAAPPTVLVMNTVRAAAEFAAGTGSGGANESVLRLAEGVLSAMTTGKLSMFVALVATLILAAVGVGTLSTQAIAEPTTPLPVRAVVVETPVEIQAAAEDENSKKSRAVEGWVKGVDASKSLLTVRLDEDDQPEQTFDVIKSAKLTFAGEPIALADLKPGMLFQGVFNEQETGLMEVSTSWPRMRTKLKNTDVEAGKLVIQIEVNDQEFDLPFVVRPNARVIVDGLKAGLADVTSSDITVEFSADKKQVIGIESPGKSDDLPAILKRFDPSKNLALVTVRVRDHEREVDIAFDVPSSVKVRFAGKDAKFDELKVGSQLRLKLGEDRRTVVAVLADEPLPPNVDDDD